MGARALQVKDRNGNAALEIGFEASYGKTWDDAGSGADRDVSCWWPNLKDLWGNGFRSLGHYVHEGHDEPQSPMLLARAIQPDALAQPVGWDFVWDDAGSGANRDVSIWTPKPPPGYSALGTFTWNKGKLPAKLPPWPLACVRNDLVVKAEVGGLIWSDRGSGADRNVSFWQIVAPAGETNSQLTYITSGSFCAHNAYARLSSSPVTNALAVQFPLNESPAGQPQRPRPTSASDIPTLNATYQALDAQKRPIPASVVYLPCTQVRDPLYRGNLKEQVAQTSFYTLERYDMYKVASWHTADGQQSGTVTFSYTTGMSKTDTESIEHILGVSLTTGVSVEAEGIGASSSITVSYSLGLRHETSQTLSVEKEESIQHYVPKKGIGCLYTLTHLYRLKRADGTEVRSWTVGTPATHYATYPAD